MAAERGILAPLMFRAIEGGSSFNRFYQSARDKGISYRRASMLADWNATKSLVESRDKLQRLDPGDFPELTEVSESRFKWTEPFVYQARVEAQVTAEAPVTERFVTVLSSEQLTIGEVEEQIASKWPTYEYGKAERLVTIEPVAAIHWIGA